MLCLCVQVFLFEVQWQDACGSYVSTYSLYSVSATLSNSTKDVTA
jgi:hypothetical protein